MYSHKFHRCKTIEYYLTSCIILIFEYFLSGIITESALKRSVIAKAIRTTVNLICKNLMPVFMSIFSSRNSLIAYVAKALSTIAIKNDSVDITRHSTVNIFFVSDLLMPNVLNIPIVFLLSLMLYEYSEIICNTESKDITTEVSAVILFFAAEVQYNKINSDFNMIILTTGITVINICNFTLINKMAAKNKQLTMMQVLNTQQNEQIKAFRSIELIYNSMKILKHDMKNEWIIVYNALQKGDIMRAEELSEKMINKTNGVFEETVTLSQPSINSIVNYKISCAKQYGIYCTSIIQDDFTGFEEYDIVMLFANLMDNAIEACKEVTSPRIDMTITTKMNYLSVVIGNSIEESVLESNSSLKTSKQDKKEHGFGIQSVKQIVDKYYGMVDFYEQDNMFYADVMLKKETPVLDNKLQITN